MEFSNRLRQLRGDASQAEAAKRAKISQQLWSKLERGVVKPEDSAVIPDIARAWGLSTEELLAGFEAPTLQETRQPYSVSNVENDNFDATIQRARGYWENAIIERRPSAYLIAKMIIVISGYQIA